MGLAGGESRDLTVVASPSRVCRQVLNPGECRTGSCQALAGLAGQRQLREPGAQLFQEISASTTRTIPIPTAEVITFITVHVRSVSATLRPRYWFTIQNPESLT